MADDNTRLASAWLAKADHDIETARRALVGDPPITDTAAYHCQQAAEKAFKAFLAYHGVTPRKTHDLTVLLAECCKMDGDLVILAETAAMLTPFATTFRYPTVDPDPDVADVLEAIDCAASALRFIRARLER
ncbi:MAG: HEPN domain-containing protein [Betaproteobacteria bacterium]|nr:HEPN domain-containing protein [Betaproteobacteria bacterium]